MRVVALLDTYWGSPVGAPAPRWFWISPDNASGRNLYKMLGITMGADDGSLGLTSFDLLCTNCCEFITGRADQHGVPDAEYVEQNLRMLDAPDSQNNRPSIDVLLVCGSVAKKTFKRSRYKTYAQIIFIPHPAWRAWTNELLKGVRDQIMTSRHMRSLA